MLYLYVFTITNLKYAQLHLKFIEMHTHMYLNILPHKFLFIFTSTLKHLIFSESHENHWSMPFIPNIYAGYEIQQAMTGGSSNVNLIDYLKGCSDLVNTQALLNTHTHTHTRTHTHMHTHQGACLIVWCVLSDLTSKQYLFQRMCPPG